MAEHPTTDRQTGLPPEPPIDVAGSDTTVRTPQPVPVPAPEQGAADVPRAERGEVYLVGHSPLVYWWPIWLVGYVMAALTWWYGETLTVGGGEVKVHPDSSLGVLFFLTLFLVILISNVAVRGYASGTVVLAIITTTVLLAYFGLWEPILGWFGDLNVYLNQGAYFWFATLMLLLWAATVFVFDQFNYWRVTHGQVTRVTLFGAGARSYDTENMVVEKRRDDLFRHWILGLGSGDLRIHTYGGRAEEIHIPNVLLVGTKIDQIQRMIATEPSAT